MKYPVIEEVGVMFSTSKNIAGQSSKIDTLIGASTNITGTLRTLGTIRINGKYTGDIFTDADVIVGEGAYIKGNILASNVSIYGCVDGNITCVESLQIMNSGSLTGDINVSNFSIDNGAAFNGRCNMHPKESNKLTVLTE